MRTTVAKSFTFDAGHRLSKYEGKCKRLHGHTYKVRVFVEGEVDIIGMVVDFGILKDIFERAVEKKFDHRMLFKKGDPLNQKIAKALPKDDFSISWVDYNPTAENIARDIFLIFQKQIKKLFKSRVYVTALRVYETPTSFAEINIYNL